MKKVCFISNLTKFSTALEISAVVFRMSLKGEREKGGIYLCLFLVMGPFIVSYTLFCLLWLTK